MNRGKINPIFFSLELISTELSRYIARQLCSPDSD